tara:strand:- start:102 stop:296 length:195 start_codon:yes stop_codon:yes gene_type:complete
MDTNELWEEHVRNLTKQVKYLLDKVEQLEERMSYYEEVIITLVVALKKGGVIVDDPNGENEMPS